MVRCVRRMRRERGFASRDGSIQYKNPKPAKTQIERIFVRDVEAGGSAPEWRIMLGGR